MNETTFTRDGNKLTVERTYGAPKHAVWQAYASPDIFAKWYSTDGWTTRVEHFDFTPGGHILFVMKCEDQDQPMYGQESWSKSEISSITPEDTFSYEDSFSDQNGTTNEAMPSTKVTISLQEIDGATKVTSVSTFASEAGLQQLLEMGVEVGIEQTYNKLANLIEA